MATPVVAVIATMDTKAAEAEFLAEQIAALGGRPRLIDIGLSTEHSLQADVGAEDLAQRSGATVAGLRSGLRHEAMAAMGSAAGDVLRQWFAAGQLHGAIAVGGNQGTAVAAIAMRALPIGPAKFMISTVASGNVRQYVQDSDITMQFSVADLLGGPNVVTSAILRRSAAAVVAMADSTGGPAEQTDKPVVGVTAFGNTEEAVVAAIATLRAGGAHCVPFHASGACGSAMERLVDDGVVQAVLDLTTHEVLGELEPADIYAPVRPGRLTAAGRAGIPQVVVPGGLEYFCFGGVQEIPPAYRDRRTHIHNPYNTNVRTTAQELTAVGQLIAERLNAATGPATVLIPTQGWSAVGSPGGSLHDLRANEALIDTLQRELDPAVPLELHEATINDEQFARRAARTLLAMMPTAT